MGKALTALVFISLFVGGCATLSESQCIASDWQSIGYDDGAKGRTSSQLLKHQNACVKHGVVPDREIYLAGWHQGVEVYCTPVNGFAQGERGGSYGNVCPDHLRHAFYDAYQQGRGLYLAKAEIRTLEDAKTSKERHLDVIKHQLSDTESRLINDDELTAVQRYELLGATKELAKNQGELEAQVEQLIAEIAVKRDRLASMSVTLAYND